MIGWESWVKKRNNHVSCTRHSKTFTVVHKMPHYWFIYHKISFVFISRDSWIKERNNHLRCIEGMNGIKDIHCSAQNPALLVDLIYISFAVIDRNPWNKKRHDYLCFVFISRDSWIKERNNHLRCIEGMNGIKDIHCL